MTGGATAGAAGGKAGPAAARTAAYVTGLGPAESIRVGPLPMPPTGPGDVLVAVEAVAVNHVDTFVRSGAYPTPTPFPFVIGRDLVGRVAVVGEGVAGFTPGDRVWCNSLGHGGRQGSFATHVVVSADRLYPLPPGVAAEDAVACLHAGATAHLGLTRAGRLGPAATVVIGGGAGAVGGAAVQLATAAGARVLATARKEDADRCRDSGAEEVFDYRDPATPDLIARAAPRGVDIFWDTSGHNNLEAAVPLLAPGGCLLITAVRKPADARAALPDGQAILPVGPFYRRDAHLLGFVISNASTADLAAAATVINEMLVRGRLRVPIGDVLPLARAAEAHHRIERGETRGRLVLAVR